MTQTVDCPNLTFSDNQRSIADVHHANAACGIYLDYEVAAVINGPKVSFGVEADTVWSNKNTLAEGTNHLAITIDFDDGVFAPAEHVFVAVRSYTWSLLKDPTGRQLGPAGIDLEVERGDGLGQCARSKHG